MTIEIFLTTFAVKKISVMKISKLLFPKLHRKIESLQYQRDYYLSELREMSRERTELGEHLKLEPFMPEDIWFKLTTTKDDQGRTIELYTQGDWKLSPDLYGDKLNMWLIKKPNGSFIQARIQNLYEGVEMLRMLGMTDMSLDVVMSRDDTLRKIDPFYDREDVDTTDKA